MKPGNKFHSPEWLQDLIFMVDITENLDNMNKMLQGRVVVTQYYDSICAFKLTSWETQLANGELAHFSHLKCLCAAGVNADKKHREKITGVTVSRQFQVNK